MGLCHCGNYLYYTLLLSTGKLPHLEHLSIFAIKNRVFLVSLLADGLWNYSFTGAGMAAGRHHRWSGH